MMATVTKRTPVKAAEKYITVEGRKIAVKMPSVEQLMAWQATLEALGAMQEEAAEFEKIQRHIDRFYRIASGLFADIQDRVWLEDARLDGVISIEKPSVLGMVTAVVEAYRDQLPGTADNRGSRRAVRKKI
jgi:hypothetical protein